MGFPIIFPWMTTAEDGVARNGCIAGAFLWRIQQSATLRVFFLLVILPMLANAKLGFDSLSSMLHNVSQLQRFDDQNHLFLELQVTALETALPTPKPHTLL